MGMGIPTVMLGFPLAMLTLVTTTLWLTGVSIDVDWWRGLAVCWTIVAPLVALDIAAA